MAFAKESHLSQSYTSSLKKSESPDGGDFMYPMFTSLKESILGHCLIPKDAGVPICLQLLPFSTRVLCPHHTVLRYIANPGLTLQHFAALCNMIQTPFGVEYSAVYQLLPMCSDHKPRGWFRTATGCSLKHLCSLELLRTSSLLKGLSTHFSGGAGLHLSHHEHHPMNMERSQPALCLNKA